MNDSNKVLRPLDLTKEFKKEEAEKKKLLRKILHVLGEIQKGERQNELIAEAREASLKFEQGLIAREELQRKFLPLESIMKRAMKKPRKRGR